MNIKKCTNVSDRALHLYKKPIHITDTFRSFSLTFYCYYSVTYHFSYISNVE